MKRKLRNITTNHQLKPLTRKRQRKWVNDMMKVKNTLSKGENQIQNQKLLNNRIWMLTKTN